MVVKRAVWTLLVVVIKERRYPFTAGDAVVGGAQVDVIVFECPPQSLDEDVVEGSARTIHRDRHFSLFQDGGEGFGGELGTLVGVEDFRRAVEGQGLGEGCHAEVGGHGVGHSPGEHFPGVPVHDCHQKQETLLEGNVGDVRRPDLIGVIDPKVAQQVGIFRMGRVWFRGRWLRGQ